MTNALFRYRVYLLRVWQESTSPGQTVTLRLSIEDSATGQRRGFADPQALVAYLMAQVTAPPPRAETNREDGPTLE